jgi:C1A family cysteine protease
MPAHALGALRDRYDPRDYYFEAQPHLFAIGSIPLAVDLRKWCSPVRDQGQQGSCTGFALTALREFWEIRTGKPAPFVQLSPAFVYYYERRIEHTVNDCDAGAAIRDGLKVLRAVGAAPEEDDPYSDQDCPAPSQEAANDAQQFKIQVYYRLTTLTGLQQALAAGRGCVLGIRVYASFEEPQDGHIPMPQPGEELLGGHALFCCGYKDDLNSAGGGYLIVKNSWSTDFGDQGYIYLPYAYVRPKLMSDMWTAIV